MIPDQRRQDVRGGRACGLVKTNADWTERARDGGVAGFRNVLRRRLQHSAAGGVGLACLVGRQRFERRAACPPDHVEDSLSIRINRHSAASYAVKSRIALATSAGLSSSARWPAPGMIFVSVLP